MTTQTELSQISSTIISPIDDSFVSRLNITTSGEQQNPVVTGLPNGNFVVVWADRSGNDGSEGGIFAQIYTSQFGTVGTEFIVNSYTDFWQTRPEVSSTSSGDFLVTWAEGNGYLSAQFFNQSGAQIGEQFNMRPGWNHHADIVGSSDGGFWISGNVAQDAIYIKKISSDGIDLIADVKIDRDVFQADPTITILQDQRVLVTWSEESEIGSNDIYAQLVSDSGVLLGKVFLINQNTDNNQLGQEVTALTDGGFAITWQSENQDGDGYGIIVRQFDNELIGTDEIIVNEITLGDQTNPTITADSDGGFLVGWTDNIHINGGAVYAQRFDISANKIGSNIHLNDDGVIDLNNSKDVEIVELQDGSFVAAWDAWSGTRDIYARKIADEEVLPTPPEHTFSVKALNGKYLIDGEVAPALQLISGRTYEFDISDPSLSTHPLRFNEGGNPFNGSLRFDGTLGVDQIVTLTVPSMTDGVGLISYYCTNHSGMGNDIEIKFNNIFGTNTDDVLTGLSGSDWIEGFSGDDEIDGGAGQDYIDGGAGNDTLFGGTDNDTLNGSDGNDTLDGGAGDDIINGGAGDDVINDGTGDDVVDAGDGIDTFYRDFDVTNPNQNWIPHVNLVNEGLFSPSFGDPTYRGDVLKNFENVDLKGSLDSIITGNDTNNVLSTDKGDDIIYGGDGNDTIDGGAGDDTLTGGSGSDTFQFHGFFEHDTITDYDSDEDILEFYASDGSALNISDLIKTVNTDGNRVLSTADGLSSVTLEGTTGITPVSGGLAMSVVSQDGDVVTFGVFADPITDPDEDGIGSFDFTLNHDASDMQIDAGSLVFATGLSGLQNYDADAGTMTAGAFTLNNVEDLDAPLLTFEATMLDTKAPISIQITDIVVDGDDFASTTEVFDFSALAITTTITDRFGNAMNSAEAQAYEDSVKEITAATTADNVTVFDTTSGSDVLINAAMDSDTDSDKAIGAFDALQALRLAVGLDKSDGTSEWHDYIAADINKDGRVGADDALNILKFAVDLTDGPSADWVFVHGDADYSAIDRKNTDYDEGILLQDVMTDLYTNMTGILLGDVDGSYIA